MTTIRDLPDLNVAPGGDDRIEMSVQTPSGFESVQVPIGPLIEHFAGGAPCTFHFNGTFPLEEVNSEPAEPNKVRQFIITIPHTQMRPCSVGNGGPDAYAGIGIFDITATAVFARSGFTDVVAGCQQSITKHGPLSPTEWLGTGIDADESGKVHPISGLLPWDGPADVPFTSGWRIHLYDVEWWSNTTNDAAELIFYLHCTDPWWGFDDAALLDLFVGANIVITYSGAWPEAGT